MLFKTIIRPYHHLQYVGMSEVHDCMIYGDGYVHSNWISLWTHSDRQAAPITVHTPISISHTVMNFWQSQILEMMIRSNDCCIQHCAPWWCASDAWNMYQFMYTKTLLSL